MADLLKIGINSLLTYQSALTVTSQNISNMDTPYYSRRIPEFTEALFNNGVSIADVNRIFDQNASNNLLIANSYFGNMTLLQSHLSNFESIITGKIDANRPGITNKFSIGDMINESIIALNNLNSSVTSNTNRNLFLNGLSNLANKFSSITSQINTEKNNLNQAVATNVGVINQLAEQIATINTQVIGTKGDSLDALLDQREVLTQKLAGYIDIQANVDSAGLVNITVANGMSLVFGGQMQKLGTQLDSLDNTKLDVTIEINGSHVSIGDLIQDGEMNALKQYRSVLDESAQGLGRLALSMIDQFNQQNKLGTDAYGNLGGNIFQDINNASLQSHRVLPSTSNAGIATMNVTIDDTSSLLLTDYTFQIDAANHYTFTRNSDGALMSSGNTTSMPINFSADGFSVNVTGGNFVVGDTYKISPIGDASGGMDLSISDGALLALGWPVLANARSTNQGSGGITVSDITDTTTADFSSNKMLNPPLQVVFTSSTSFNLVNANTSAIIEGPISYNPSQGIELFPTPGGYDPGYRINISGAVRANDAFDISYNSSGSGDNRNGLKLAQLFSSPQLGNGVTTTKSFTYSETFLGIANHVSMQTSIVNANQLSARAVLDQANSAYAQVSGVSLEEETGNLMSFQQAYQASAQIVEMAKRIFDTIISLAR